MQQYITFKHINDAKKPLYLGSPIFVVSSPIVTPPNIDMISIYIYIYICPCQLYASHHHFIPLFLSIFYLINKFLCGRNSDPGSPRAKYVRKYYKGSSRKSRDSQDILNDGYLHSGRTSLARDKIRKTTN